MMPLNPEYLPATRGKQQELVLLHGWGSSREIWRPLLAYLRPWASVTLLDIPGCTPSLAADGAYAREKLLDAILAVAPRRRALDPARRREDRLLVAGDPVDQDEDVVRLAAAQADIGQRPGRTGPGHRQTRHGA